MLSVVLQISLTLSQLRNFSLLSALSEDQTLSASGDKVSCRSKSRRPEPLLK